MGLRVGGLVKATLPGVGCVTAMYAAVRFAAAGLSPSIDHRLTLLALSRPGFSLNVALTLMSNRVGYRDVTSLLRRPKS